MRLTVITGMTKQVSSYHTNVISTRVSSYDTLPADEARGGGTTPLAEVVNSAASTDASSTTTDPFVPFHDLPDEDRNILTLRAIVVGVLCGGLVNASNIYVGLKAGWTGGANIFGV